jgi:parallel beta-helix repeat protein
LAAVGGRRESALIFLTIAVGLIIAGAAAVGLIPLASQGVQSGVGQAEPGCDYTISQRGSNLVAVGSGGTLARTSASSDIGAFLNGLLAGHEALCLTPGIYVESSEIQINHLSSVTLSLAPGATIKAPAGNRILLIYASLHTVVRGGQWIGSGAGEASGLRVLHGSNDTIIRNVEVSNAGADGILIYNFIRPNMNVSIQDSFLHNNGRYGVQEYSKTPVTMSSLVSGNLVVDNQVGGIYTNGVAAVNITRNIVRNTVGNGPGEIGIGVTNAYNDTVTLNQVDHMMWFGIQTFYNNRTLIANNTSSFNAGGWDQSGITNDHSSFSTIAGNTVESNGKFGVYVERSWNVTVSGNLANGNHAYGIGFHHGDLPTMGRGVISRNICSFNSLGVIVLNSAVDNVVSMNQCNNNSGDGILLYNDPGQAGSTGNIISGNLLGNEAGSLRTQMFGIREGNGSINNTLISNVMTDNLVAATSLLGSDVQIGQ